MKNFFLFLIFISLSINSFAGTGNGTIVSYVVILQGKLFFHTASTSSAPACSIAGEWAVDLVGPNATAGKALLAAVMAASAQNKTVSVTGSGACDVWGDRETVSVMYVIN